MRVRSQDPRELQDASDLFRTSFLGAFGKQPNAARSMRDLESVVIDARRGTAYGEVIATIDALPAAGLTDMRLVFAGTYGSRAVGAGTSGKLQSSGRTASTSGALAGALNYSLPLARMITTRITPRRPRTAAPAMKKKE